MPKRSKKKSGDPNVAASRIVKAATRDKGTPPSDEELRREAARILGSLGGNKGGPARAKKLSAKRRKEIAKEAADARWGKRKANG